jgi:hypothetical protein
LPEKIAYNQKQSKQASAQNQNAFIVFYPKTKTHSSILSLSSFGFAACFITFAFIRLRLISLLIPLRFARYAFLRQLISCSYLPNEKNFHSVHCYNSKVLTAGRLFLSIRISEMNKKMF